MKKSRKYRSLLQILAAFGIVLAIGACAFIDSFELPASAKANQEFDIYVNVRIDPIDNNTSKMVIAFLAPKSWNVRQNATLSYTNTLGGDGKMALIPEGTICPNSNGQDYPNALKTKFGIGGNLIDDVEWVAFQSSSTFIIKNGDKGTARVKIHVKPSSENMLVKLGFYFGCSADGFAVGLNGAPLYQARFSDCFEVTDGDGDVVDFCNPQIAAVEPAKSTDNDLVTITFDNGLITTPLTGVNDVYICAKAYLMDGSSIEVCPHDASSKFLPMSAGKFRFDFWPRGYFKLTDAQSISRIEYFVTNADGTKQVGYGGSETAPFVYTFKCN